MNLEKIEKEWSTDCRIDETKLAKESVNVPFLHSKYYSFYVREKLKLDNLKLQSKRLEFILERFYQKNLSKEELDEYGLEYPEKKIMNKDVPSWINTNDNNIELKKRIVMQNEKVEYLKSILDQISKRSFHINNAISWKKFEAGE